MSYPTHCPQSVVCRQNSRKPPAPHASPSTPGSRLLCTLRGHPAPQHASAQEAPCQAHAGSMLLKSLHAGLNTPDFKGTNFSSRRLFLYSLATPAPTGNRILLVPATTVTLKQKRDSLPNVPLISEHNDGRVPTHHPSEREREEIPECGHSRGWHKGHEHEQRDLAAVILKAQKEGKKSI